MSDIDDLVFCSDDEPGIQRLGQKRFRYVDQATGAPVRHRRTLERIRALAVPPAWRQVWICPLPNGHLQATGRDDRERKQYRYHAEFRRRREAEKFADLVPFGEALGPLRAAIEDDLALPGWSQDRVVALTIALLDGTALRIGNEQYARDNGTFGLTTLRNRHAIVDGHGARLKFVGKHDHRYDLAVEDPVLARLVRRCRQLPGQLLLQWIDDDGEPRPIRSNDVNDRLRTITGLDVTAKAFRTWAASVQAARLLADAEPPASERAARSTVLAAVDEVADVLGNTRAVCRASYVHPAIPAAYASGQLADWWRDGPTRAAARLAADERRLLGVLRRARRAGLVVAPATVGRRLPRAG